MTQTTLAELKAELEFARKEADRIWADTKAERDAHNEAANKLLEPWHAQRRRAEALEAVIGPEAQPKPEAQDAQTSCN